MHILLFLNDTSMAFDKLAPKSGSQLEFMTIGSFILEVFVINMSICLIVLSFTCCLFVLDNFFTKTPNIRNGYYGEHGHRRRPSSREIVLVLILLVLL